MSNTAEKKVLIKAANVIIPFADAANKPELDAEFAGHRLFFKLSRASKTKDEAANPKQHYAVAVPAADFTAYYVAAESDMPADAKATLQAVFTEAQDELIADAIMEAIGKGSGAISEAAYNFDAIIKAYTAERTSSRIKRADVEAWATEIAVPALVNALVAKGVDEEKITAYCEALVSWLCKLVSVNPALSDKQAEQCEKALALEGVEGTEMAVMLSKRLEAMKASAVELADML